MREIEEGREEENIRERNLWYKRRAGEWEKNDKKEQSKRKKWENVWL